MYKSFKELQKEPTTKTKIFCENCRFFDGWGCKCYYLEANPTRQERIKLEAYTTNFKNNCQYFEKSKWYLRIKNKHLKELDKI